MNRLTIALFLAIPISLFAQTNSTAGYVIKANGDTLWGLLQLESKAEIVFQIQFKANNSNSVVQTFSTNEVKAFKYETGDQYKRITFKNTLPDSGYTETVFALELVNGTYNLYSYILNEQTYFIVENNSVSYFLYNTVFNANGSIITEGNYISRLSVLSVSCPNRSLNADQINFNEKDVSKFIFDLNNCISPNSISINHYQKPKTTSQIVLFAGGMTLGKNKNQVTVDAAVRSTYPQLSKSVSINIGIHFSHSDRTQNDIDANYNHFQYLFKDDVICVPLTLQYNFKIGPVVPYLSGGFAAAHLNESNTTTDYYAAHIPAQNSFGISVIAAVGAEASLGNDFFAKVELRYEFFFQYPVVGIQYAF